MNYKNPMKHNFSWIKCMGVNTGCRGKESVECTFKNNGIKKSPIFVGDFSFLGCVGSHFYYNEF